jgi:hypothetical protein
MTCAAKGYCQTSVGDGAGSMSVGNTWEHRAGSIYTGELKSHRIEWLEV